jgi:ribonuclease PH
MIDCDVLQADGGTRTASVTGGCVALGIALGKLIKTGKVSKDVWVDSVAAISVGMKGEQLLVDLDYDEDSSCDIDMNFIMTGKGGFVEVQGTGEKRAFLHSELTQMTEAAKNGIDQLKRIQSKVLAQALLG